ncbi:MAG: bifunctional 2-C-methyl-D-erythritol 4-phosphate cytidylyltransferase/2-C-methyl-D-erythritol 2,4-cyclodiphosphate synthase [Sulfurovum sp.]|nr:bifunctional 2-C-methyl-D-erythritol 4-phosphate cytidylyltransferase/2-C-methyl-D-erythritol 2,4-cyclodiphosphate synthase [Sulfurovum sp.]
MSDITLVLLAAGNSTRFTSDVKKQWLMTGDTPIWLHVAEHFSKVETFDNIIIVSSATELNYMKHFASYTYVEGGESRQASLKNALARVKTSHVLVSDVARCCVPESMIHRIIAEKETASCVVPTLAVTDTMYLNDAPIDREQARIIQTPQLSVTTLLKKALQSETLFTDDSSAIASLGEKVHFVQGSSLAHKLTTLEDLQKVTCLKAPSQQTLTGFGIDTHPFETDKKMFLCGVEIDVDYGFKAHSDGDVAIHAVIDALLGAAGMGDIGELYPDTDHTYAGADSKVLLRDTVKRIKSFGFCIGNIDMTIVAESPKINPYKTAMRETLAEILEIRKNFVNIKATTSEKLGFVGRNEGVTVHAVANLTYLNWKTL